jgi:hypothetical protein
MEISDTLQRAHGAPPPDRPNENLVKANDPEDRDLSATGLPSGQFQIDEDLERLIAETLGVGRARSFPEAPGHERTVRSPLPVRPPGAAPPGQEIGAPVEPLVLESRRRPLRLALAALLAAGALAAGWWLASGGLEQAGLAGLLAERRPAAPRQAPLIAAAPTPARPADAPAVISSASVGPSPAPPAAVAASPPAPDQPALVQPAPVSQDPAPVAALAATESAGVLGRAQSTPFDQATAPKPVRTTAVVPPGAEQAARVLDFDDPATWPPGAVKADPHPLPPRRRR